MVSACASTVADACFAILSFCAATVSAACFLIEAACASTAADAFFSISFFWDATISAACFLIAAACLSTVSDACLEAAAFSSSVIAVFKVASKEDTPLRRDSVLLFKVFAPSANAGTLLLNCSKPSRSSFVPSANCEEESESVSIASSKSLKSTKSSTLSLLVIPLNITLMVISMEKSFTSAVTSTYSGISISSEKSEEVTFKLSFKPGIATPTTMFLSPSEITLPFLTLTFVKLSSKIIPVIMVNGT